MGDKIDKRGSQDYTGKLNLAVEYWTEVSKVIPDWRRAKNGEMKPAELRQEKINTHAVVMRALGGAGRALIEGNPQNWKQRLSALRNVDWRKSVGSKVNPAWDNVCITAGSVVSNRQARAETLAVLKGILGISPDDKGAPSHKPAALDSRRRAHA